MRWGGERDPLLGVALHRGGGQVLVSPPLKMGRKAARHTTKWPRQTRLMSCPCLSNPSSEGLGSHGAGRQLLG